MTTVELVISCVPGVCTGFISGVWLGPWRLHVLAERRAATERQIADAKAATTKTEELLELLRHWREDVKAATPDAGFPQVIEAYNGKIGEFAAKSGSLGETWKSDQQFNVLAHKLSAIEPKQLAAMKGTVEGKEIIIATQDALINYMVAKMQCISAA